MGWCAWLRSLEIEPVWVKLAARDPGYCRPHQRRVYLNRRYWRGRVREDLLAFVIHEAGHILSGRGYHLGAEPRQAVRGVCECQSTRRGLKEWLSDDRLKEVCHGALTWWEVAEDVGLPVPLLTLRVAIYRAEHGGRLPGEGLGA